jgi:hypothetical protein
MSESVWFEQVDTALLSFIPSKVVLNSVPVAVKVRKPDDDLSREQYPLITFNLLYHKEDTTRMTSEERVYRDKDVANSRITVEKAAIPYVLTYQIDFWSLLQTEIAEMTRQWFESTTNHFNLPVKDVSGIDRSSSVRQYGNAGKSDFLNGSDRIFHCFATYKIWVELDANVRDTLPMLTTSPEVLSSIM